MNTQGRRNRGAWAAVVGLLAAATAGGQGSGPVFAPIRWPAGAEDPGAKRVAEAVAALTEVRAALRGDLEARAQADAAREPGLDLVLDLAEPFTHYALYQLRPNQGVAPPWRGELAHAIDRYHNRKQEFQPAREDARLTLSRRGGQWIGPQVGMLSAKLRQQFHLRGADAAALKAAADGVTGDLRLTTVRGDFRFDMHMSGESCDNFLPEYGTGDFHIGFGDGFYADWWAGPRDRMRPWEQSFRLDARERRGWLLRATLGLPVLARELRRGDTEVFLWVDEGRARRGYVGRRDRPFQGVDSLVSLDKWELQDKALTVAFDLRLGDQTRRYSLRGELARPDGGAFSGRYSLDKGAERVEGPMGGVLYLAFAGAYATEGLDGKWSRDVLAGVAPVSPEIPPLSDPAPEGGTPAEQSFRKGLALYRQIAALDRALREYPLPLAVALQEADDGTDNRNDYWALRYRGKNVVRQPTVTVQEHLHEALAAEIAPDAGGAAAYLEGLVGIARRARADRQAGAATVVGVAANPDPDFGPYDALKTAPRAPAGGNALPPPAAAKARADWRVLGDWTCFGPIPRAYSFDSAPHLPEVAVAPALRSLAGTTMPGQAVRIPYTNEMEHLWVWRAEPDEKDGRVTMSRTLLMPTREDRSRWGTNYKSDKALFKGGPLTAHTGTSGDTMDFFYQLLVTWYATTTLHAERAERVWMAAAIGWDGRLWVNGSLVWRPDRLDTPNKVAVFPVDLAAGENRITVSCSARPIQDGNMGNMGARIHKYAERMYGAFSVWTTSGGAPRSAAEIAAAAEKERAGDVARAAAATPVRGHRGDGSGFYPTARPPVAWDLEKNINVRWKVSLPTRDAEPVIVGKNLFLTTVAGELACLDADTGAERWRKQPMSNGAPVPLPPPPTSVIGVTYDRDRQWPKLGAKNPAPGDLPYDTAPYRGGFTNACLTALADLPAPDRAGGQAGGQRVWMHDHRGVVACFGHDGAQVWAQSVPAQVFRMASGQECRSRTVPPVPPAGVGPLLIVAAGDGLIAFDRASGAEKWRRLGLDYLGRFAPMDLGDGPRGRLLLLCSGEVLDAATGETLIRRCAPEMNDSACQPVVDGRVAYFHAGSAAVRFWVDGDGALCHRVLWDSPADVRKRGSDINSALHVGSFAPTPVLYKGLLLTHMADMMSIEHGPQNSMRVHASDAATGCAVSQRHCVMPNGMNPALSTIVAGDLMYCGDRGGKTFGNYPTFPETPRIFVMQAGEEPRRLATNPNLHTRSHPVCEGRRLYLAGEGEVVCIERPEPLGDRFSEYELAALQKEFYALEIGVKPETAEAVAIAPLDRLPEGTRAPVVPLFVGSQTIPWDKSSAPLCEGFPWQLVGAWPLPDAANDDVYAAMTGNAGKVVGEGCQVKAGDQTVAFRAVPPAGLTARKRTLECATMNYLNAVDTFALNTTNLFAVALPARGLFAAVLDNRRDWTLACDIPANARVWLGGHEIKAGEHLRLASGLYPFLIECRVDAETVKQPIGVRFYEYPPLKDWPKVRYNPAKEMARWLDRVRANEALLRAIAASGPTGAYAQEALDALASGSSRTH